jgi:hypothetical protein
VESASVKALIIQIVAERTSLKFEDLTSLLPALSWNQLFSAIDRLS